MAGNYILTNQLSSVPTNPNIGWNNSWLKVENNGGRPLFASAAYITNLSDLVITLSGTDTTIGDVHISDPKTGLEVDVVQVGVGSGAMRVLTQDLTSDLDSITIGDHSGNMATVVNSALRIFNTNPITSITISNPVSNVYITNPVNSVTVLNPISAVTVLNPTIPGFNIPTYTEVDMTYIGSTNNYNTIVYKNGLTTVGTITFTYVGGTPSTNDALVSTMVRTN